MKILNGYCGIGGNRKLWGDEHEITAIELNSQIAEIYKSYYPKDKVIITDVHDYLLKHFQEFDFIWLSPPCQSHSRINTDGNRKPRYPDMKLYQEIIMLSNNWYKGLYCIENVIPYYEPLIRPSIKLDRHLFWSNFRITKKIFQKEKPITDQTATNGRYGFDISGLKINHRKDQILRNLVNPEVGKHILDCAINKNNDMKIKQIGLFKDLNVNN